MMILQARGRVRVRDRGSVRGAVRWGGTSKVVSSGVELPILTM